MKNFRMMTFVFSLSIIAAAYGGVRAQNDRLGTERWTVSQMFGQKAAKSSAYFAIGVERTKFTGDTGCNRMFGSVSLNGSRIDFSNIGMTKRMCKMPAGSIPENTFVKALDEAVRYRRNGATLNLYNARGRHIIRFIRMGKQPPAKADLSPALTDRKWMLETVGNGETFAAIEDAFVVFDRVRGSAGGNSGCNAFGGTYTTSNNKFAVVEIISTMRACIEDDKMAIERKFLDGLQAANRYEINDNTLYLFRGQKLLLTLRGEPK